MAPTDTSPAAMTDVDAADYIGVDVGWLRKNRRADFTPPFCKYGARLVRYRRCDLDEWLSAQVISTGRSVA